MSAKKHLIPRDFYVIIQLPLQKWQWPKKKKGKKKIYSAFFLALHKLPTPFFRHFWKPFSNSSVFNFLFFFFFAKSHSTLFFYENL